jgi:hypothetical protein
MSDDQRADVRATLFNHLAGIVLAPTVKALSDRRVFDLFESSTGRLEFDRIVEKTRANRGYMRVALRMLASAGWLKQAVGQNARHLSYELTNEGRIALGIAPLLYGEVTSFVSKAIFLEDFLFGKTDGPVLPSLSELVRRSKECWAIGRSEDPVEASVHDRIRRHLDGMLVGPSMVALARAGVLALLEDGPADIASIAANRASLNCVLDLLAAQGWVARDKNRVWLTASGHYAAQIATAYGVTVSYLPLFDNVSTLLFGNPRIPRFDENGVELLINRGMNVWGSGGAHKTYFKQVEEIIVEIFNQPLDLQPSGICDMGCGDGTFLEHLYSVVKNRTTRGGELMRKPLALIGADFNKVARRVAKQNLRRTGIPIYHVIAGDINRPAQLASDLEELGYDIHDLLHVRSFLDHNRPYSSPANYVSGQRIGKSTGAFAHLGDEIPPDELEENLVRHLRRWAPYVGRYGLLVLELHTLPPELTAANLDKTPALAYDGTHGFSDQYLVELPLLVQYASEAGLQADPRFQSKFPPSELATVSLTFFMAAKTR